MNHKTSLFIIGSLIVLSLSGNVAAVEGFAIRELPVGTDVTLPGPAITLVPLTERVKLSATDSPQTIKLSSVSVRNGTKGVPLKVTIFDSKNVRYITLDPSNSYMYSFSKLGTISLVTEQPKAGGDLSHYQLRIESDKPLNIAR